MKSGAWRIPKVRNCRNPLISNFFIRKIQISFHEYKIQIFDI